MHDNRQESCFCHRSNKRNFHALPELTKSWEMWQESVSGCCVECFWSRGPRSAGVPLPPTLNEDKFTTKRRKEGIVNRSASKSLTSRPADTGVLVVCLYSGLHRTEPTKSYIWHENAFFAANFVAPSESKRERDENGKKLLTLFPPIQVYSRWDLHPDKRNSVGATAAPLSVCSIQVQHHFLFVNHMWAVHDFSFLKKGKNRASLFHWSSSLPCKRWMQHLAVILSGHSAARGNWLCPTDCLVVLWPSHWIHQSRL